MQRNQVLVNSLKAFGLAFEVLSPLQPLLIRQSLFFSSFLCNARSVWIASKHLWTRTSALLSLLPLVSASIKVFPKLVDCKGSCSYIPAKAGCYSRAWKATLFYIMTFRTCKDIFSYFGHCQRDDLRTLCSCYRWMERLKIKHCVPTLKEPTVSWQAGSMTPCPPYHEIWKFQCSVPNV